MKDQLREALAAYAHEAWAGWMDYLFRFGQMTEDGQFLMDADKVARWKRQAATPYADLSEAEKQSDRAEADRMLALMESRP